MTSFSTHSSIQGPVGVGPYQFVSRLGKGGMGTVYRATHVETGADVAVKILKPELAENGTLVARFMQEFRAAAKLDHPNLVRSLDAGMDGVFAYLVMEFVDGRPLGRMLARGVRIPERAAVRIITQVAQALHYAHRSRIIHRDVKPDNIIVRGDGLAKLADFGLAKDFDDDRDLTRTKAGLGTPHFMAPEQYADAKKAGILCDIYGLGATLYNALTGKLPFGDCPSLIALARKTRGEIPSPRELVPELSEQVDLAVRRAMSPDPGRRPANCIEFLKLLPPLQPQISQHPTPPSIKRSKDRRAAVRRVCGIPTTCMIDTDVFQGGGDAEELWPATVHDLSATGAGLILARRFEPETIFSLQIEGGIGKKTQSMLVKVVRVHADEVGHWFHGCRILPNTTKTAGS